MVKRGLSTVLIVLATVTLFGCGASGKSSANAGAQATSAAAASSTGAQTAATAVKGVSTTAAKATVAGKKVSDCTYAKALVQSLKTFTTSLPTATTASSQDAIASYNTFNTQLTGLINQLKSYQLSPDVAKVNAGVISVFQDMQSQLAALTTAAQAGDVAKITDTTTKITQDLLPRLDAIQQQNKATMDKLNKCVGQ